MGSVLAASVVVAAKTSSCAGMKVTLDFDLAMLPIHAARRYQRKAFQLRQTLLRVIMKIDIWHLCRSSGDGAIGPRYGVVVIRLCGA